MPSFSTYADNNQLLARFLCEIDQRISLLESQRATWTGVENVVPRTGDPPYVRGDIMLHDGSRFRRLALGANDEILVADDTYPEGARWGGNAKVTGEATLEGDVFITNNNGMVIGHTAQISFGAIPEFQILGTGAPDSSFALGRWSNNAGGATHRYLKSRNATIGLHTIVQDGDELGRIRFQADDGTDFNTNAAEISAEVDGTPGFNDMPGRLLFSTTADGASSVTERMRLNNQGSLILTGRLQGDKGADVASADEIALGTDGNYFDITGTTTINHITKTNWQAGSVVVLQFDASVTVTHNAGSPTGTEASIILEGGVDFSAAAGDTLPLVYDGTTFREIGKPVATEKAFDLQPFVSVQADLFAVASTTILTATESGLLQGIGLHVVNTIGAAGTATLDITVDGGTKRSLSVYNAATTWDGDGFLPLTTVGTGSAANNTAWLPLNIRYLTSILVAFDVTNVFASGDLINVNVLRGIAL